VDGWHSPGAVFSTQPGSRQSLDIWKDIAATNADEIRAALVLIAVLQIAIGRGHGDRPGRSSVCNRWRSLSKARLTQLRDRFS
jgi:hypothetical protein